MTPEDVFAMVGGPALIGWVILTLGPRRFAWLNLVPMIIIPSGLSAVYAVLVLTHFASPGGGFGSLAEVRQLFSDDWVLLAGWVHYLAFDLMVGAVTAQRLDRANVPRLVQAPLLILIFLFGPLGLFLAIAVQTVLAAIQRAGLVPLQQGSIAPDFAAKA